MNNIRRYLSIPILSLLVLLPFAVGCGSGTGGGGGGDTSASTFVGASACAACHQAIYDNFMLTGHPYKLNKVPGGDAQSLLAARYAPNYPFSSVPNPPDGYTWDDVSYVIGGFNWKARFIGLDGFIITGDEVQYNLETQGWVAYHSGETKPYDCGRCHTTGYSSEGNQDGLEGLIGTWQEDGVTCEACHGAGSKHVASQSTLDITKDRRASLCGQCHYRDSEHRILASGGFIKHHEQYDEMLASPHNGAGLDCITCHDPHKSAVYDAANAIVAQCTGCHTESNPANMGSNIDCVDCHMPRASKSAIAISTYQGDVRTHLWKIDATKTIDDMFYVDPDDGKTYANDYVTLEFVCLGCHEDKDMPWAQANSAIH